MRRVEDYIAESWNLECVLVALALCDVKPAVVVFLTLNLGNTDDLEVAICKSWDPVTLKTTSAPRSEDVETPLLFGGERIQVSRDVAIKRRMIGGESLLKRRDRP